MSKVVIFTILIFLESCFGSLTAKQFNVTAIKNSRDQVPAQEILNLMEPLIVKHYLLLLKSSPKNEVAASAEGILKLISDLGSTARSTGKTLRLARDRVTWIDAYKNCTIAGEEFATINNADEQLQAIKLMLAAGETNAWLGATDLRVEGQFEWVGQCTTTVQHTFWLQGEPNNVGNAERCLETTLLGWNDLGCVYNDVFRRMSLLPYFCQKPNQ